MSRWELIHEFKCTKNRSVEFDVYDNQGVLSLESMLSDELIEVYLSEQDENKLRDILNKRHKEFNNERT